MTATWALARFHARAGGKLALRGAVPMVGVVTAAIGSSSDPGATLERLTEAIARGGSEVAAAILALSLTLALWAEQRLVRDGAGWLCHLPATASARRRGAVAGLVWAQMGVIIAVAASAVAHAAWVRLPGAILVATAVSQAVLPARRAWVFAPAAVAAAWLAATGGGAEMLAAAALVVLADRLAGPMGRIVTSRPWRPLPPSAFAWGVSRRALGPGSLLEASLALLPVGAAALFAANNDFSAPLEARVIRLAGVLGATVAVAVLAERLAARRPPWPWERTLPRSARDRVRADAVVLGAAACVPPALAAALDPLAGIVAAAFVPWIALRGAAAMRRQRGSRTLAAGPIFLEGSLVSLASAVAPWVAPVALAGVVWALRVAERAEKERSVSHWIALHHDVRGDSLSWSGR